MSLILASASPIRHAMLSEAGVPHQVIPSKFDETTLKQADAADDAALALELAASKAREVSLRLSGEWVIGADSIVSVAGRRFSKPSGRTQAAEHLAAFSGKPMQLTSAVALVQNGEVHWCEADRAILHVRQLSAEFIHNYLEREWPAVGACVGVFRMEGPGIQLFDSIEGTHFTILGLPLLPLLGALRERNLMPS